MLASPAAAEPRLSSAQISQFDNRPPGSLSLLQVQIMRFLVSKRGLEDHLTTGAVVDGIGRKRDKAGYASVSRSLVRLWKAELVVVFQPGCNIWGSGFFYWASDRARSLDWSGE
jgi:hypothetical protein